MFDVSRTSRRDFLHVGAPAPLDPRLSLHDASGRLVAESDDAASTRDAALRVTLPADGAYSLVLVDANNQGGTTHVYLLRVRSER